MQNKLKKPSHALNFLVGGGKMGALIQTHDWSDSPLGPPESWTPCLKSTVAMMLPADVQIVLFWGEEYAALYNDTYAPTIGDKHPHALGRPAGEYWTELWNDLKPLLDKVYETGETLSAKDRPFYIERHGYPENVYFDISYSPVRDEEGTIAGILCIVNETTERILAEARQKQAETILRESEKRKEFMLTLSDALRQLRDPAQIQAEACRVVGEHFKTDRTYYAELDFTRQLAFIEQDYVRGTTSSLVGAHPLASFNPLLDYIRTGQPFVEEGTTTSSRINDTDKAAYTSRGIESVISVPLIKAGELVAAFCVTNTQPHSWSPEDVVQLQEVAERTWEAVERARAEEALKKALQQKDEFLGIASHELKTPVTSIKAYAQVLRLQFAKAGNENAALQLGKMDAQLNKLTALIRDLLDITKMDTGKLQFHEDYFAFDELVDEIVEQAQLITKQHAIQVQGQTHKTVYGNRDRIGQVLMNFLSNAIKYSPDSDAIIVKREANAIAVTVSVQDFGLGIPEAMQEKVFERFYRITGDGRETYPGLGLGLYISSEFIKRQGGKIWLESKVGEGSTFCFSLPIIHEPS